MTSLPSPPRMSRSLPRLPWMKSSPGPPSMSLSSPARDSTRKSSPSPPVRLSSPSPPSSRSSPCSPSRTSLPSSPYMRSLPKPPKIRSLAVPPSSWSLPAPPRSESAPLPPDTRSLPPPPSRWSVEPPPDMMFAPAVPVRRSESAPPLSLAAVAVEAVMSRRRAATSAALEGKRMPRSSAFGRQSLSRCADLRHPTNEPDIVLTRPGRSEMVVRAGRDRAPHPTSGAAMAQYTLPRFRGELISPGEAAYDEARSVWNGMFDRHPALIARCATTEDVVAAVTLARAEGVPLAVRGGGHSAVGHSTCDDGIVIDLSAMNDVRVEPIAKTARAQGGATWGDFDTATQTFGLAVTGGRYSTTGIAGLTLGSGSGWLERKCGLTADNLISAQVVTADGRVVRASATENEELFWGLRGGGGNFGVVTEFESRLHDVGPIILGGMLICPPERAGEILRFARDYMATAPD